jgi:hypothetical protein
VTLVLVKALLSGCPEGFGENSASGPATVSDQVSPDELDRFRFAGEIADARLVGEIELPYRVQ